MRFFLLTILCIFSNYSYSSYIANFETLTKNKVVTLDYLILKNSDINTFSFADDNINIKKFNEIWVNYKNQDNSTNCSNIYKLSFINNYSQHHVLVSNSDTYLLNNILDFDLKFNENIYAYYLDRYFNINTNINPPVIKSLKNNTYLIQKRINLNVPNIRKIRITVNKSIELKSVNISYKKPYNFFVKYFEFSSLVPVEFNKDYYIYDINIPHFDNISISELFIYIKSPIYNLTTLRENGLIKVDYETPINSSTANEFLTNVLSTSKINNSIIRDTIDISPAYNTYVGLFNKILINNHCNKELDSIVLVNTAQIPYPLVLSQIDTLISNLGGPFNLNFKSKGFIEVPDIKFFINTNYFNGKKIKDYYYKSGANTVYSSFIYDDKSLSLGLNSSELKDLYITFLSDIDNLLLLVNYDHNGTTLTHQYNIHKGIPFSLDRFKDYNNIHITLFHKSIPLSFYLFKPTITSYPQALHYNFPIIFDEKFISQNLNDDINIDIIKNTYALNKLEFFTNNNSKLININLKFIYENGFILNQKFKLKNSSSSSIFPINEMLFFNNSKLRSIRISHDSISGISSKFSSLIYSSLFNQIFKYPLKYDKFDYANGIFFDFIPLNFNYNFSSLSSLQSISQSSFGDYFNLINFVDENQLHTFSFNNSYLFFLLIFLLFIIIIKYNKLLDSNIQFSNIYFLVTIFILSSVLYFTGYLGYFITGYLTLPQLKLIFLISSTIFSFFWAHFYSRYFILLLFIAFYIESFPLIRNQIVYIVLLSTFIYYVITDNDKI